MQKRIETVVHKLFIEAVTNLVAFSRAGTTNRVVATTGISGDRQQWIATTAPQHRTRRQVGLTLGRNRIHRRIAIRWVVGIIENSISSLVSFHIDNSKGLPSLDFMEPTIASRDNMPLRGLFRIQVAFGDGQFICSHVISPKILK